MTVLETSSQLFKIVEDGLAFEPDIKVNGIGGSYLEFENLYDTDDGIFTRVSDWTRLMNRIDEFGAVAWLDWMGKAKMKIDYGYCTIQRDGKWSNAATIYFREPILVVFGHVSGEPITSEVNQIRGEFTYEWGWLTKGRQDKIANIVTIYFDCKEFKME